MEPEKIAFDSQASRCIGYLYRCGDTEKRSAVVLGAGFGGTQDTPSMRAAACAFAAAGFAAFTFDYRHFGESAGLPRQVASIRGQLQDFHAAIRAVRALPGIRPEQLALWGSSLGGGHAVTVAAADPAIAAVVAQVPFNGFPRRVQGRSARATWQLLQAMSVDRMRGWLGYAPRYIQAVGNPGELAVMATPQAMQAIAGMRSEHWRNQIAPRVLFEMMWYKPSKQARRLRMPLLLCVAEHDREAPPCLARQIAQAAPRAQILAYPVAHFDFYRPEIRARILQDQILFLREQMWATRAA